MDTQKIDKQDTMNILDINVDNLIRLLPEKDLNRIKLGYDRDNMILRCMSTFSLHRKELSESLLMEYFKSKNITDTREMAEVVINELYKKVQNEVDKG